MEPVPRSAFHHRDFTLFWVSLLATGFAMQMAIVAIGWQVYSVRENPLDLGLDRARGVPAAPAACAACRPPRGPRAAPAHRRVHGHRRRRASLLGAARGHASRCRARVAVLRARVRARASASAFGAPAGRALTPSLVPQEILVSALAQRSIAFQLSNVAGPAVGGILFAIQAELVYVVSIALSLVALGCVLALRSGREPAAEGAVGTGRGPRRRSPHPADEGALRRDLARPLRRALRRRGRAAPDLREGHPRGRADRARVPAHRAGRGRVRRGPRHRPPARYDGVPGRSCSSSSRASASAWSSSGSRARCGSRCSLSRSRARSTW